MRQELEEILKDFKGVCQFNTQQPKECPYTLSHNLIDCRYIAQDKGCMWTPDVIVSINYRRNE